MYGNNQSRLTEAKDGVAFATTGNEEDKGNSKGNKKKEITCYKCKKMCDYAYECEVDDKTMKASNKKGSNFLVLNKDQDSSDDKDAKYVAVKEDKKEEEYKSEDDTAEEEGITSDDEDMEMMMNMKVSHSYRTKYYAQFKTSRQY